MTKRLLAAKAISSGAAAAAIVFTRNIFDPAVAVSIVTAYFMAIYILDSLSTRREVGKLYFYLMAAISLVIGSFSLVQKDFPAVGAQLALAGPATYYLVLKVRTFWTNRSASHGRQNLVIEAALQFAILAWVIISSSLFSSVDLVALFGVFSAYAAMLTVHWGIEATGPRREG